MRRQQLLRTRPLTTMLILTLVVLGCGSPSSQTSQMADTQWPEPGKYDPWINSISVVVTGNERLEDKLAVIDRHSSIAALSFIGTHLTELPTGISKLPYVSNLIISRNYNLKTLPAEIGSMANLKRLDLRNNDRLVEVPPDICQLGMLGYLVIEDNGSLETLPDCMAEMHSLERVYLHDTNSRVGLWEPLGNLADLAYFNLWVKGVATPEILAGKLTRLPHVKRIDLSECDCPKINGRIAMPAVACQMRPSWRKSYACLPE